MGTAGRLPAQLYSFLGGLVLGLGVAAAAAVYITNAPVPFVSKVQRLTDTLAPDRSDPNQSLFSPLVPGPNSQASAPAAAQAPAGGGAGAAAPAAAGMPPAVGAASGAVPAPGGTPASPPASGTAAHTVLQVGAYRSPDDADAMRARLALLGFDAQVVKSAEEGGLAVYRVRLGPFGPADDVNGILRTLSENGVDAQQVSSP